MEQSIEIWKDVVGFEGLYQVSDLGRVKSFKRGKDRILKPTIDCVGYYMVILYDSKRHGHRVHGLVSAAFLNHKPDGHRGLVCNHINFDRTDNRLENLELVTNRENTNCKHRTHSSIYTGVSWFKRDKKWKARIRINGKLRHLGYFTDELEASLAYEKALLNLSGYRFIA